MPHYPTAKLPAPPSCALPWQLAIDSLLCWQLHIEGRNERLPSLQASLLAVKDFSRYPRSTSRRLRYRPKRAPEAMLLSKGIKLSDGDAGER